MPNAGMFSDARDEKTLTDPPIRDLDLSRLSEAKHENLVKADEIARIIGD